MITTCIVYLLYATKANNYSSHKTMIVFWMCMLKSLDAFEDIFYGMYQQNGRLDIAGKCLSVRISLTMIIYIVTLIIFKNQLISVVVSTIISAIIMVYLLFITYPEFSSSNSIDLKNKSNNVTSLLINCLPLFLGSFLMFYIGNAPKYAIDSQLSDEAQACYAYIAMPVFVVGLLNGFIFNPIVKKLSDLWQERNVKEFVDRGLKQILIIGIITAVCILGAWLLGIPVLSLMYNTDLSNYKTDLIILILGGGFLGLAGLLATLITIIRFQKSIVLGYGITALLSLSLSNKIVKSYGVRGATILYLSLMICVCVIFSISLVIGINKNSNGQ